MIIEALWEGRDLLGESPVWHHEDRMLYWVDAIRPGLHALDPNTQQHHYWDMPALIGSIAPRVNGGLVAAIGTGFAFIDLPSGRVDIQKAMNEVFDPVHLNDGKCDRAGRFWAGEVSHDKQNPQGKLYCFDPKQAQVRIMETGVTLFNGPCWSPDNKYFYYTDSFTPRSIFRYQFDLKTGNIAHKEVFIQIPADDPGVPDGCTVDSEGYLWSAKWNGFRITRYRPDGTIEREIEMPVQRPTSVIFGGDRMDTLFVTSASKDVGEKEPLADLKSGQLFKIVLKDIRGIPETPFRG